MNKLFLYIMIVLSLRVYADDISSIEVLGGGLTYHLILDDPLSMAPNAHKISKDGRLISNPESGVVFTQKTEGIFQSEVIFGGEDSIGHTMVGGLYERGYLYGNFQLGLVAGAYGQDDDAYRRVGTIPFKLLETKGGVGIVPITGIALNYEIPVAPNTYLKLNNIVSPILTNTSLSVGFNF